MFANLSVVAPVQSHPVLPEVFEEGGQDLSLNVVGLHTISATTLFHHLWNTIQVQVRDGKLWQMTSTWSEVLEYQSSYKKALLCNQRVQGENREDRDASSDNSHVGVHVANY